MQLLHDRRQVGRRVVRQRATLRQRPVAQVSRGGDDGNRSDRIASGHSTYHLNALSDARSAAWVVGVENEVVERAQRECGRVRVSAREHGAPCVYH